MNAEWYTWLIINYLTTVCLRILRGTFCIMFSESSTCSLAVKRFAIGQWKSRKACKKTFPKGHWNTLLGVHLVLVVYLNDDDRGVRLDVLAPPVDQDLVKHEQLVPRGRKRFVYHLQTNNQIVIMPRHTQSITVFYVGGHVLLLIFYFCAYPVDGLQNPPIQQEHRWWQFPPHQRSIEKV